MNAFPLFKMLLPVLMLSGTFPIFSQTSEDNAFKPHHQPLPWSSDDPSWKQTTEGNVTTVVTPTSAYPEPQRDPFVYPPGTNFLPTIYTNIYDGSGNEMLNTLPSTPNIPYNLHDGEPVVTQINEASPTDDLFDIMELISRNIVEAGKGNRHDAAQIKRAAKRAIDIIEGNTVPNRAYSGFPLLHYDGPNKYKKVEPIFDADGNKIGGNVNIRQIWYDQHIESDCSLLDVRDVLEVPWTVTYTVDVLSRGRDDFSPFVIYTDDPAITDPDWEQNPPGSRRPLVGMDASFFPMAEGTRSVIKIKMTPGKYLNLTYTWGWRMHPPRIQSMENAQKVAAGKTLIEWEQDVFGDDPKGSRENQLAAIAKISDLAPAKRMWHAFRAIRKERVNLNKWGKLGKHERKECLKRITKHLEEARNAYFDWRDRTKLPAGIELDPESDITIAYLNNTIYGELTKGGWVRWPDWTLRGANLHITIHNGDYFQHGYMNVDFGGARGWENQFKSSVAVGGSGCWFTFGRAYWQTNLKSPVMLPAATGKGPDTMVNTQKVHIVYNYEPSRRLRFYQFDPLHHDVAIFSIH